MILKFFVLEGLEKDSEFRLKPGQVLGRHNADIALSDLKISSQHARVETDDSGNLVLIDLNSTNGIKISGRKVPSIQLHPGLRIRVGNTLLEVRIHQGVTETTAPFQSKHSSSSYSPASGSEVTSTLIEASIVGQLGSKSSISPRPSFEQNQTPHPSSSQKRDHLRKEKPPQSWNQILVKFLGQIEAKVQNQPKPMVAFNPLLTFDFIRGLQFETQWLIGYGPRQVGSGSIDLPIFESGAPAFVSS